MLGGKWRYAWGNNDVLTIPALEEWAFASPGNMFVFLTLGSLAIVAGWWLWWYVTVTMADAMARIGIRL